MSAYKNQQLKRCRPLEPNDHDLRITEMTSMRSAFLSTLMAGALLGGCETKNSTKDAPAKAEEPGAVAVTTAKPQLAKPAPVEIDRALLVQFSKLPDTFEAAENPITKEKSELGRALYFDTRLSKSHDVSCNSCHNLDTFGVDNKQTSEGYKGKKGRRNAPTVYNAAGHFVQFWDGRAKTVEEQAKGPALHHNDAQASDKTVVATLASMPGYADLFKKAFPTDKSPVSIENVARAIGAFERTLSVSSRFDRYVAGDEDAITEPEKAGLKKYLDLTCTTCHAGSLHGAMEYKKLGQARPWPNANDLGRYEVTKVESDKQMFKTSSLRNVAKTAPYLHDGSVATLEEMIKLMAAHQVGKSISDDDATSVAAFLGALTGEPTAEMRRKPVLPESTAKTPKPDAK
jgi:cytochrome c peroxidase